MRNWDGINGGKNRRRKEKQFNKPRWAIRCVSQAEILVFGSFAFLLTDIRTDIRTDIQTQGHTDGHDLLMRCDGASKNRTEMLSMMCLRSVCSETRKIATAVILDRCGEINYV